MLDSSSGNIVITSPGEDIKFHTLGSANFGSDKITNTKMLAKNSKRHEKKPGLVVAHPQQFRTHKNYLAGLPYRKPLRARNARSLEKIS